MNDIHQLLNKSYERLKKSKIEELSEQDFDRKIVKSTYLRLDWSKNLLNFDTFEKLIELGKQKNIFSTIHRMFSGAHINITEDRAVLHTALRHPKQPKLIKDSSILKDVHNELKKVKSICDHIHGNHWRGFSGKPIKYIINVGIGGSFLGPKMLIDALKEYSIDENLKFHFLANLDLREWMRLEKEINLEESLFIISSKSMGTIETLMNINIIIQSMRALCSQEILLKKHFIAVTSNPDKLEKLNVPFQYQLNMWDWTGGRFSVWSSIGLPVAIMIGFDKFTSLLRGAHLMDEHFYHESPEDNMPICMALISYWYRKYFNIPTHAILAYHHGLKELPNYLQQLDMESNGKSVTMNGSYCTEDTAQILWGGEGTNGQHAYHQLLHQGSNFQNVDFIVPLESFSKGLNAKKHQAMLVANAIAQSRVLMKGHDEKLIEKSLMTNSNMTMEATKQLAKHKAMKGNKPSNIISMKSVSPESMGELIALYEHRTSVLGWLWNINSFDQWGVELGKTVSNEIYENLLSQEKTSSYDASTNSLINQWKQQN